MFIWVCSAVRQPTMYWLKEKRRVVQFNEPHIQQNLKFELWNLNVPKAIIKYSSKWKSNDPGSVLLKCVRRWGRHFQVPPESVSVNRSVGNTGESWACAMRLHTGMRTGVYTECHQTGSEERGWGERVRRFQQFQTQVVQPRFRGCWESPSSAVGESRDLPLTPPCPPCPLRNFPIPAHGRFTSSKLQTTPEPLHPGIYNKRSEF